MKTIIEIPQQEKKEKLIGFKLTDSEQQKVKDFCAEKKVSLTFLMRTALKNIIPNFEN